MKNKFALLFLVMLGLTACEGDTGPPGPQGPPGEDGLIGTIIDIEGDFTSQNDFSLSLDFNQAGVEVFESDVILVYLKTGEDGEAGGEPVEVFRLLPQTFFLGNEILQYNFDFTFFDVLIFLDGTVNFDNLDPSFTEDQVFRIAIIPAEFAEDSGIDLSNMQAVMKALDLEEREIQMMDL